jgi:hypothetical protein
LLVLRHLPDLRALAHLRPQESPLRVPLGAGLEAEGREAAAPRRNGQLGPPSAPLVIRAQPPLAGVMPSRRAAPAVARVPTLRTKRKAKTVSYDLFFGNQFFTSFSEFFRVFRSSSDPSEFFGVLRSSSEFFRVLRSSSEFFGVIRSSSQFFGTPNNTEKLSIYICIYIYIYI